MKISPLRLFQVLCFPMSSMAIPLSAWDPFSASTDPASQPRALYDLFLATGMSNISDESLTWFNPDSNATSYCMFNGVRCDSENYVTILDLNGLGLAGTIPDSVSDLERLNRLRLDENLLRGPIPHSLTELSGLVHLNLGGGNSLTGQIPSALDNLTDLRRLKLGRNALSGTIPSSLCGLKNLVSLDLEANTRLEGTLPACLSSLRNLNWLRVTEIGLLGKVPRGLCGVRDMNGLTPNTFGCDVIACPVGFHRRGAGRQQTGNDTCVPCDVPSNTLGSASCHWVQTFGPTPRSVPEVSEPPSTSPLNFLPTRVPSVLLSTNSPTAFMTASLSPTTETSRRQEAISSEPSFSNSPSLSPAIPATDGIISDPTTNNGLPYEQGELVGGTVTAGALLILLFVLVWKKRKQRTASLSETSQNEIIERSAAYERECLPPQNSLSTIEEEDSEIGMPHEPSSNETSFLQSPSSTDSSRRVRFSLPDPWPDDSANDERISDVASAGAPSLGEYAWALQSNPGEQSFDRNLPDTAPDDKSSSESASSPILQEDKAVASDFYYGLHAPSSERDYTGIIYPTGVTAGEDDSVRASVVQTDQVNVTDRERWYPVNPDLDEWGLNAESVGMAEI